MRSEKMRLKEAIGKYVHSDFIGRVRIRTLFFFICGLIAVVFKCIVGFYIHSVIWIYSALYGLCIVTCKDIYLKSKEENKEKAFFDIAVILFLSAFLFLVCVVVKSDLVERVNRYPARLAFLFNITVFAMFIASVVGVRKAHKRRDVSLLALRFTNVSSALMHSVLIEEMFLSASNLEDVEIIRINTFFGISVGIVILVIASAMLAMYWKRIRKKEKTGEDGGREKTKKREDQKDGESIQKRKEYAEIEKSE